MARSKRSLFFVKLFSYFLLLFCLFSVYFITAFIGLRLNAVSGFATLIWAPSGISLAALLLFGYRVFPAITLAAFLVNYVTGAPPQVAAGISIGNSTEAVIGTYLLSKVGFDSSLQRIGDVVRLIVFGAIFATTISATIGVTNLLYYGLVSYSAYWHTWIAWWVGDMLGILVITPLVLSWAKGKNPLVSVNKRFEALAWFSSVVGSGILVFSRLSEFNPLSFLVFPPLVWGALRFNLAFNSFATFVLSIIAIWGTLQGFGPFVAGDLSTRLLFLQLFIGVLAVANMLLTAAVSDSRVSEEEIRKLNKKLREKIKEVERLNKLMVSYIQKERNEKIKAKPKANIEDR